VAARRAFLLGRRLLAPSLTVLLAQGAAPAASLCDTVVGGHAVYEVQPGDSLTSVGARFGVEVPVLARTNGLAPTAWLVPHQRLQIENSHVVPARLEEGILLNLPQRMLFRFEAGRLAASYPVGLGRPDWPTPTGTFTVVARERDKTWNVPPSIQEEMRRCRQVVRTQVPPGPDNPLGKHWIGLSLPGYGIHGTIAPASVYHFQSHGCVRLHPDDAASLFEDVHVGTPGVIVYTPVLLARLVDERLLLEVHRDVYRRDGDPWQRLRELAETHGLEDRIDWERARHVVDRREGIARDVRRVP
jgi:L,D-transpeptidase ErfK/SrfK